MYKKNANCFDKILLNLSHLDYVVIFISKYMFTVLNVKKESLYELNSEHSSKDATVALPGIACLNW